MIKMKANKWKDSFGILFNHGKCYFTQLVALFICEVSHQRDEDGPLYGRKTMTTTGIALETNDKWKVEQLSHELQCIVSKYQSLFNTAGGAIMQQR